MCIICLEFNKHRDLVDAHRMVEAARREADSISPEHLREVEKELEKRKDAQGQPDPIDIK